MAVKVIIEGPSTLDYSLDPGYYYIDVYDDAGVYDCRIETVEWNSSSEHIRMHEENEYCDIDNINSTTGTQRATIAARVTYSRSKEGGPEISITTNAKSKTINVQGWRPVIEAIHVEKDPMLSTDTNNFQIDLKGDNPTPDGVNLWEITYSIYESGGSNITMHPGNNLGGYFTYNDYSLGSDKRVILKADVSWKSYKNSATRVITVKPSLTGLEINPASGTLTHSNTYTFDVSATPLPYGTGAPITYQFFPEGNQANRVSIAQNGRTGTIHGIHPTYEPLPIRVRAGITNSNPYIYFDQIFWATVTPNMTVNVGAFRNGTPFIYDNGWKQAKEVYIYDNGWRLNRVK